MLKVAMTYATESIKTTANKKITVVDNSKISTVSHITKWNTVVIQNEYEIDDYVHGKEIKE